MKKEKLGFFKKLFLVITDFRTYPFLIKYERFLKSMLYLITMAGILSLIYSVNSFSKMNSAFKEFVLNYNQIIPEFELTEGVLSVDEKYNEKIADESIVVVDTGYTAEEYKKTKEYSSLVIYDTVMLINSDKTSIELNNKNIYEMQFKDFNYNTTKAALYNEVVNAYESSAYIPYLIIINAVVFVGYFIRIILKVIVLAFTIVLICWSTSIKLNFRNFMKLAIYTYSLPLIMELIASCLGVGGKDYTYYAVTTLTFIYIMYALRAVRLDRFIMMFSSKNAKKYTTAEFENELKKYNELLNGNKTEDNRDTKEDKKDDNDN